MNKIVSYAMVAAVGLILLGGLLVPTIDTVTEDTKTYYNNNYGSYALIANDPAELTIDNDGAYYLNGELVPIASQEYILMSDHAYLRYSSSAHELVWVDSENTYRHSSTLPMALTISNNTIVGTVGTTEVNIPFDEWCGVATNDGDYRICALTSANKTVYVNDLNQLYGCVRNATTGFYSWHGENLKMVERPDSQFEIDFKEKQIIESNTNPVYSVVFSSSADSPNRVEIFSTTPGEEIRTMGGDVLVPAKIYGQTDTGRTMENILYVIPIMIIIAMLVFAIQAIRMRND